MGCHTLDNPKKAEKAGKCRENAYNLNNNKKRFDNNMGKGVVDLTARKSLDLAGLKVELKKMPGWENKNFLRPVFTKLVKDRTKLKGNEAKDWVEKLARYQKN